MPRSIWTGAISFGLVTVPVKLYSAVSRKTVRFHQLNGKTGVRIQQKRVDPTTGDEVAYEDIVKGYELTPDRYVLIEPGELEALDPKKTKSIEIEEIEVNDRELAIAGQLVESLATEFEAEKFRDSYREDVLALIERKAAGEQIAVQPAAEEAEVPVPDLMSALKASLDAVRAREDNGGSSSSKRKAADDEDQPEPAGKKAAAKKQPTAKK